MLTAAWLGQGTLHLLVRRCGVAWGVTGILAGISVLAGALVLTAPLTSAATAYQNILSRSGLIIALTIVFNIYGTLVLVGAAIYSAYIFWRKRLLFNRMIGNVLFAAGALAPAKAGVI